MNHNIALNFEDGVTRVIQASPDEILADAAYRQGVNIPLDCRDGACGACKCKAESGTYDLGAGFIDDALSDGEVSQGYVLTCQMRVKSDCVIQVPATSDFCKAGQITLEVKVTDLVHLSLTSIGLTVQSDELARMTFLPGQYANLTVPGSDQTRAYSFCSMPEAGSVRFLIRNVPGGRMSTYLAQRARVGDTLTMSGPLGSFYLRDIKRPLLMLAGGTGLAPFIAMLDKISITPPAYSVHLIYGVSNDEDLVELSKLENFVATIGNFTFTACVSSPDASYPVKGYVTDHLVPAHLNGGDVDIYLCGPSPMVDAVHVYLNERHIKPNNFYYEKFVPGVEVHTPFSR
ncbi:benzoate 1,2-dioxygenase electron transfer component BenC [Halopseudomonas pelagia]|uniref:benzoate 1,2-dioxygenase electron transfer component BenC n=1 Tax=Halopseudomonas pelagia TaxID=553151 RepID=UPI0030D96086|tara:strand:+ start:9810 stop:10844 length:1035 start_codon:yes stop_codon:yes gene_type:complete